MENEKFQELVLQRFAETEKFQEMFLQQLSELKSEFTELKTEFREFKEQTSRRLDNIEDTLKDHTTVLNSIAAAVVTIARYQMEQENDIREMRRAK